MAQTGVWSVNFLPGLKVEIRQGWLLFGRDLKAAGSTTWEQLTCNFSVGSGIYAMLRWGQGQVEGFSSALSGVQSAAKCWLKVW